MNLPTIIVALIVAGVVAVIVVKIHRNKIKGKRGCSCGGNCEACNSCHTKE